MPNEVEQQAKKPASRVGEIIRFVITGGVCFLVEFVVLVLLVDTLGLDTLVATPIAFAVSVVVNYFLCMAWVFEGTKDSGAAAKVGFAVTSVIGLLLNELLMLLFRVTLGETTVIVTVLGFTVTMYMLNKCLATLLVMVWNYFTKRAVLQSSLIARLTQKLQRRG